MFKKVNGVFRDEGGGSKHLLTTMRQKNVRLPDQACSNNIKSLTY